MGPDRPARGGDMQTVKQLGDRLAQAGHPLKPRTIQTALGERVVAGLARGLGMVTAGLATGQEPPTPAPASTVKGAKAPHDPPASTWRCKLLGGLSSPSAPATDRALAAQLGQ